MIDFDGDSTHKIDKKGRIFMPSALLEEVDRAIAKKELDPSEGGYFRVFANRAVGCFDLYTESEFRKFRLTSLGKEKTAQGARLLRRFIGANTRRIKVDSQNRILLPEDLRSGLPLEGEVEIVGCGSYIEVWDAKTFLEKAMPEADNYYGIEAPALRNPDYVPEEGEQ